MWDSRPLDVALYRDERLLASMRFRDTDYLVIGDDYGTTLVVEADRDAMISHARPATPRAGGLSRTVGEAVRLCWPHEQRWWIDSRS
jgi:hypothetical protein